jgi:pilus assembly protein Flp/PilA
LTHPANLHTVNPPPSIGELPGKEVKPPMFEALISFINRDEEGQGLAEYALILALIAIVAIIALIFLGSQVSDILDTVATSV